MTTRTMSKTQRAKFEKHLLDQGCELRTIAGGGWIVRFPDGGSTTVHTTSSDIRSTRNAVAMFRRHGVQHPNDPKEIPMPENDDDYPEYMTGPIAGTTRKKVLAALERLGWPPVVRAQELPLDTVTAHRALYAVGYRLDPKSTTRNRIWNAPDEIVELHKKVKAEMAEREAIAKAERAVLRALPTPPPVHVVFTSGDPDSQYPSTSVRTQDERDAETPDDEPEEQGLTGVVMPPEPDEPEDQAKPEREFIDSEESWTVKTDGFSGVPTAVRKYLAGLRAAGLSAEIRVWRA